MSEDSDLQIQQGATRGAAQFRREIRSAVRGLWSKVLSWEDSWESMDSSIRRLFRKAYHDGAREMGVLPSELTASEKMALRLSIQQETSFISKLLDATEEQSRDNGGKLGPLYKRVELWVQRYQQIYTDGQMTARDDPKMAWRYDHGAMHCSSCLKLNGKIKRLSSWERAGLQPQSPLLECMREAAPVTVCKCHFEPTTEPASKGPLPKA